MKSKLILIKKLVLVTGGIYSLNMPNEVILNDFQKIQVTIGSPIKIFRLHRKRDQEKKKLVKETTVMDVGKKIISIQKIEDSNNYLFTDESKQEIVLLEQTFNYRGLIQNN